MSPDIFPMGSCRGLIWIYIILMSKLKSGSFNFCGLGHGFAFQWVYFVKELKSGLDYGDGCANLKSGLDRLSL
jgi:hypothetical protein